jgi:hypothetical protein
MRDKPPVYVITREVCFDYGELIWEISINSNVATAEADKVIFEHLLDTFQILD